MVFRLLVRAGNPVLHTRLAGDQASPAVKIHIFKLIHFSVFIELAQ